MKRTLFTLVLLSVHSFIVSAQDEFIKVDGPSNNRLNKTEADNSSKAGGTSGAMKKAIVLNATPAPQKIIFPTLRGVDPMVAAGDEFVIISQDHSFAFYDKNGNQLGSDINATTFFQEVIDKANENSFPDLADAPDNILSRCATKGADISRSQKILNEAYDTRVIYEPVNKRFIIVSAVRNQVWQYDKSKFPASGSAAQCNPFATRIFAFSISKTNDPRDGFHKWYWTKNNYRDWPRISADKDVLTFAHAGTGPGSPATPSIYVISLADMMAGKSHPRYFTYMDDDYPGSVIPFAMYKSNNSVFKDYVMYLRGNGTTAELYYFKKTSDMWTNKPDLNEADIDLGINLDFQWYERPVYRNGKVYFTSRALASAAVKNKRPDVWGFWLFRLPLSLNDDEISFNESSSLLMKQHYKPTTASGTNYDSYDIPSYSVDAAGTILLAYGRSSKTGTSSFLKPQSRYLEHIQGETNHRNSHILKAGVTTPLFKQTGWSKNVVDGFFHSYNSDIFIDYSTVVPDPSESKVFWIAHSFASPDTSYIHMVVGKVKADK